MYLHGEKHDTRHVERQKHDDGKEQGSSLADLYPSVPACCIYSMLVVSCVHGSSSLEMWRLIGVMWWIIG